MQQNPSESAEANQKVYFEPEKIIVFDLFGPMAHFRNVQTNSSSLTYYFPPPTTIIGLIAGIIGLPRDSYYDQFSMDQIFLALEVLSPLRKQLYTVNYRVWVENGHTQIPVEILLPDNSEMIKYRIYFSCSDDSLYHKIFDYISENRFVYPPFLGAAEFLGQIEFVDEVIPQKIPSGDLIKIHSILRADSFKIQDMQNVIMFPEYIRYNFRANRIPGPMVKYFYIAKGEIQIEMKKNDPFYSITIGNQTTIVCRF